MWEYTTHARTHTLWHDRPLQIAAAQETVTRWRHGMCKSNTHIHMQKTPTRAQTHIFSHTPAWHDRPLQIAAAPVTLDGVMICTSTYTHVQSTHKHTQKSQYLKRYGDMIIIHTQTQTHVFSHTPAWHDRPLQIAAAQVTATRWHHEIPSA